MDKDTVFHWIRYITNKTIKNLLPDPEDLESYLKATVEYFNKHENELRATAHDMYEKIQKLQD